MNRQRLDSPLVYVGAHNVYYVKLPVKVLYFTIHIHTQIGFAPIFPDTCYHLTHYWLAAADIPVASDNPVHYA
nr:hypothetical protein [Escherichia coli]